VPDDGLRSVDGLSLALAGFSIARAIHRDHRSSCARIPVALVPQVFAN